MKTIGLKSLLIITSLFLSIGAGCDNEGDKYEEITLEYSKCPCEHETNFLKKNSEENVLLFNADKTSFIEMKELSFDGERSVFFKYSTESDTTFYYSIIGAITHVGYICNFPEVAKEWEIQSEGIYITYSAEAFELCKPKISIATHSYSNLVLTSLKKLKK